MRSNYNQVVKTSPLKVQEISIILLILVIKEDSTYVAPKINHIIFMILVNTKIAHKDIKNVDRKIILFALKIKNAQFMKLDIKMKTKGQKKIMNT